MPDILTRLKFFMIAPRIKRRRGAPSTLVDRGYTVEPLVPLVVFRNFRCSGTPVSDDEIVDRAELPSWTMTQALFWLGGYRSPGYESTRHMQDHFFDAYTQARLAIRQGDICQKTVEGGETIFYDRPENWLAWADRIGPEYIKVDERMRRALSQVADSPDGTVKEEPQPIVSKATVPSPAPVSKARESWTQDRYDYWHNRAKKILSENPHSTLLGVAMEIEDEDAPDHLPDDQKEAWKKKGWTIGSIQRRLKGRL